MGRSLKIELNHMLMQCWFNGGLLFTPLPQTWDWMPRAFVPLKTRAAFNQHIFLLVYIHCDTMLVRGCTGVIYGGPTLSRHWVGVSYTCKTTWLTVVTRPASARHSLLPGVECMPASASDAGPTFNRGRVGFSVRSVETLTPALNTAQGLNSCWPAPATVDQHWVSVVLTCSGLRHQPEIVMNKE